MQFADKADGLATEQHAGAAAGVHRWVLCGLEHRLQGCEQRLHVALHVEEVDLGVGAAPLQLVGRAVSQTCNAHGLLEALDCCVALDHGVVAQEHAAQLEHANAVGLAVDVELEHLQQRAEQRRAHHAQVAGDRVQQLDGVGVARQLVFPLFFNEAEVDGFLIAQSGQFTAHGEGAAAVFVAQLGRDRSQRLGGRQVFVADHARDFFDQVFFDVDVEAERRSGHGEHAIALLCRQTQTGQRVKALLLRERHADDLGRARHAQRDGLWLGHVGLLVVHDAAHGLGRAADFLDQLRDAFDVLNGTFGVHAALEAMAGIGREIEVARTASNGLGPPESGLDVDVLGVVGHGRGVAAHDAGERFDFAVVSDHADLDEVVERHGVAVEQLEGFALFRPAHVQRAVDLVEVKNVRRTAELEHHVV